MSAEAAADVLDLGPLLEPDQQRRLACLALAVESRTSQSTADELVERARTYDRFVQGGAGPIAMGGGANPYGRIDQG